MAFIPDEAVSRQYDELTPAAAALYNYYCMKRNKKRGGWSCPEKDVLAELKGMKRAAYFAAKKELILKKWIEVTRNFVRPLIGFESPENPTYKVQKTRQIDRPKSPEKQTSEKQESPENPTESPENPTYTDKDIPAPSTSPSANRKKTDSPDTNFSAEENGRKQEKKPRAKKPPSEHKQAMQFLHETIGPYPDGGAQGKAAKWILANGFTLDDIKRYLPPHAAEYEQKKFRASYLTLQKEIGKLKRLNPPPVVPPASEAADEYEQAMLEIRRADNARYDARKEAERMNGGR